MIASNVYYIQTPEAPLPVVGTMNQAVVVDGKVFVSGTLGYIPKSLTLISSDIVEQTRQTFQNVIAILNASSSSPQNVVQATIYLSNIDDMEVVDSIYNEMFGSKIGAKTYLQVPNMYSGSKIQMETVAVTGIIDVIKVKNELL